MSKCTLLGLDLVGPLVINCVLNLIVTYNFHIHQPPFLEKEANQKVGSIVEVIQAGEPVVKIYLP